MLYLNIAQVESILRAAYENKRDHLLILLEFTHAGRAAELANLKLADVANNQLHLKRVKNSVETWQGMLTNDNILFDEQKALAAWIEVRPKGTDALFPSRKGGSNMRPDSVGKLVKRYMEKVGIPSHLAHGHALKHACLANLLRSGVPFEYVKTYAGHRSASSTLIYLGISDQESTEKAQKAFQMLAQSQ